MTLLDTLRQLDQDLVDWLLHASPRDDDERATMQRILTLRGSLSQAINGLVAGALEASAARFPDDVARVNAAAARMTAVGRSIDTAQEVLTIAGTALEVLGKVAAFVA
jgi:hypothetical protein